MDKKQLELASTSLKIYLEITIKDELINLVKKNPDAKLLTVEMLVDKITSRLRQEEQETTQIIWKSVMRQMADIMKNL